MARRSPKCHTLVSLVAVLACTCVMRPATAEVLFAGAEIEVNGGPSGLAIGQLDGNGHDVAVAELGSDSVTVLLHHYDGTFYARHTYDVGGGPESVAIADLNGDGLSDLAVANYYSGDVSTLFNLHGHGTFGYLATYDVGQRPKCIRSADLDGDGDSDLVAVNFWDDSLSVLLNHGDGAFAPNVTYTTGDGPDAVVVSDLDGDGDADLGVANAYSDTVSILLNNGDGTFADQSTYSVGDWPTSIAIADVDWDEFPDLAVANSSSDTVSILLNNGDGTFFEVATCDVGNGPRCVAFAYLDDNGDADLVVTKRDSHNISILLNYVQGGFAGSTTYGTRNEPSPLAVGRLDGDFDQDIVVASPGSRYVSLLYNNGDGTIPQNALHDVGISPRAVATDDLDADGDADLAVANGGSNTVSILLNHGDGTFADDVAYSAGNGPSSVGISDFDGDGDPDVAVTNYDSDTVSILLNQGGGTYVHNTTHDTGQAPSAIAIEDLNGDDCADLAVANGWRGYPHFGGVSILLGNCDGTFPNYATHYDVGQNPCALAIADLDADSDADLVVADRMDDVKVLLNNGDGTFVIASQYDAGLFPRSVAIADLDGDSHADVAVANTHSDAVSILRGNGDGTFTEDGSYGAGSSPLSIVITDLDADSDPDLAVTNIVGDNVSVLINNGDGTFSNHALYRAGDGPSSATHCDVDGDGDTDLVVTNENGNNVSLLYNQSGPYLPQLVLSFLPTHDLLRTPNDRLSWYFSVTENGDPNRPVADATVQVLDPISAVTRHMTTDADGRASYHAQVPAYAPAGEYEFRLGPAAKPGYSPSASITKPVKLVGNRVFGYQAYYGADPLGNVEAFPYCTHVAIAGCVEMNKDYPAQAFVKIGALPSLASLRQQFGGTILLTIHNADGFSGSGTHVDDVCSEWDGDVPLGGTAAFLERVVSLVKGDIDGDGVPDSAHSFDGVDLDFEQLWPWDEHNYRKVVSYLRLRLPHRHISIAVLPGALLDWGNRYALSRLRDSTDSCFVMGYDLNNWGVFIGQRPNGPWDTYTIPLHVRLTLQAIVGPYHYPAPKVVLGMPFYGRWGLDPAAVGWGNLSAISRSIVHDTSMDTQYREKYFLLTGSTDPNIPDGTGMYINDEACLKAKARLALHSADCGFVIGGVGAWQLGQDTESADLTRALMQAAAGECVGPEGLEVRCGPAADLFLEDPAGRITGPLSGGIPGAAYIEPDHDDDGTSDYSKIIVQEAEDGTYTLTVEGEPGTVVMLLRQDGSRILTLGDPNGVTLPTGPLVFDVDRLPPWLDVLLQLGRNGPAIDSCGGEAIPVAVTIDASDEGPEPPDIVLASIDQAFPTMDPGFQDAELGTDDRAFGLLAVCDGDCGQVYTITYWAVDASGNITEQQTTINNTINQGRPDCNGNGLPDECDLSLGVVPDCNLNSIPDDCETLQPADFDSDLAVDKDDFLRMADCLDGPCLYAPCVVPVYDVPCCTQGELDGDYDIDLSDISVFQRMFGLGGNVLHVPSQYSSIQAAIDAAVSGDTVQIADGTYTGAGNKNLDFGGKAITVRSASGDPVHCIIDCEGDGRGFYFHSGEGQDSIVDGLTITNGSASIGAGLYCSNGSSPVIRDCIITDNTASSSVSGGGGVCCHNSSHPALIHCTIRNNTACGTLGCGGGVNCDNNCSPELKNCTITDNSAAYGGAVYCTGNCGPTADRCIISHNFATYWGGGICCLYQSGPTLTNCLVSGNTTDYYGGGVFTLQSSPMLFGCTVSANSASLGAAIALHSDQQPSLLTMSRCILRNGMDQVSINDGSVLVVTYCDVEAGIGEPWFGTGCIDADPLFRDPDGTDNDPNTWEDNDFRLMAHSPCIDEGDPNFVPLLDERDLDGHLRVWDGDGNGVGRVDMGAYEFGSPGLGDLNCDGWANNGDIDAFMMAITDTATYDQHYPDCDPRLADINGDGYRNNADIDAFMTLVTTDK